MSEGGTLVLIIITLFRNCKLIIYIYNIYLINHVSAETLTTGRMIPLETKSKGIDHNILTIGNCDILMS